MLVQFPIPLSHLGPLERSSPPYTPNLAPNNLVTPRCLVCALPETIVVGLFVKTTPVQCSNNVDSGPEAIGCIV